MSDRKNIENLISTRADLIPDGGLTVIPHDNAAEGGCGVIGIACNEQIPARHLLQALTQMRNRGNGKGGGIAAVGLNPDEFGVDSKVMQEDYLLSIAYLNPDMRTEVERTSIEPTFLIDHIREQQSVSSYQQFEGLDVQPPEVIQYFVRVRPEIRESFVKKHNLKGLSTRRIDDEIVYQNSFRLNSTYYASTGESHAFVLSHGKNLLVLKMVGYGDDVIRYYRLEDIHAHVWIGHHRYPTKGRVWHPGGAHPFVGLNEALVHNGDFANYASISEYLSQRNIFPLYLTDTEVSVLVFDLLHRTYDYPLEYVIEALAPTTERDFTLLPHEKQITYAAIQKTHMHCSPDGPWFFLIAQSDQVGEGSDAYRLIGITDTSMLRPQVFALQQSGEHGLAIGFAASEKQAIDAALESLSREDHRFWPRADKYWNARGGSHTDGGAFIFTVQPNAKGNNGQNPDESPKKLICTDKFGLEVGVQTDKEPFVERWYRYSDTVLATPPVAASELYTWFKNYIPHWSYAELLSYLNNLNNIDHRTALETLTSLIDHRYPTGSLRRSSLLSIFDIFIQGVLRDTKISLSEDYIHIGTNGTFHEPSSDHQSAVVDARGFNPEGENSLALAIVELYRRGFKNIIIYNSRGHRFIGNGLGRNTKGLRIDVYGSSGDYLASGLDGAEIHVHGSGQDQLAQIMKSGKLVVHGDVGQTFGYAAKGGSVYILGNAAGRPMINAVGKPRVIINGTCLDYLAESFMAGDPHNGGGFVILNGVSIDEQGLINDLDTPYPGGNLFSLASGGAIYIRDPGRKVSRGQLNGGDFQPLEERDWQLIKPYLEENERLFDVPLSRLLAGRSPDDVYRKIRPRAVRALQAEEAWVQKTS